MGNRLAPDFIELNKGKNGKDDMVEVIEDILSKVKSGELECFVFAAYDSNNEIQLAKGNIANITEEQTLVSTLQTMVMLDTVEYAKQ